MGKIHTVALLIILHLIKQVIGLDVARVGYFVALALPHTHPLPHGSSVCEIRAHFLFSPPYTSSHTLKERLRMLFPQFIFH